MIRVNLLFGALLALFGGWYLWLTTAAPRRRLLYDPGIMFVPKILACGLMALSVLLILQQIVSKIPHPEEAPPDRLDSREWLQTFGLLALTAVYAAVLPWLGFLLTTPIYLLVAMLLSGARRGSASATAVVVTGVIYVSFVYFFKVSLPPAPLP